MICPKCNSTGIGKEVTRRGWSGDYVCLGCGYNDAKDGFQDRSMEVSKPLKLKLRKNPLP